MSASGAKPTTRYGASPPIQRTPISRLVARLAERLRFSRFKVLWSDGALTLEAACEYLHI